MTRRERITVILAFLVYALGLCGYVVYRYHRERHMQLEFLDARLRMAASVARQTVGASYHDDLEGIAKLPMKRQIGISRSLDRIVKIMGIKFVYSLVEVDGKFYFAADSDVEETTKNGIWKDYPEATEAFTRAYERGEEFVEEVTDRWGEFRSIAVPFRNKDGKLYMMGADVTMAIVHAKAREAAVQAFGEAMCFLLLLIPLGLSYISHLRHQNRRLEQMVEERTHRIATLIDQTKRYLPPQLYSEIVGGRRDVALQRRVKLTVFFSDVKDFTAITEQMEAETMARLLNSYLSEMSKIALKYGGTIDKYVGDAIMVFFGAPEFHSDQHHAQACVRMAVEMRERLKEMRAEWHGAGIVRGFHVRMGISTGYCTVGSFGSEFKMDYTAIGTIVNLAARLQSAAAPDHILVSSETYALCRDIVEVKEMEEIDLKGLSMPVKSFELVGVTGVEHASLLRETPQGFELRPISLTADVAARDRVRIARDLRRALALLEKDAAGEVVSLPPAGGNKAA